MDSTAPDAIAPILPEFLPRLTNEFVQLYNRYGARKLAGHQVPIETVPFSTSRSLTPLRYGPTPTNTPSIMALAQFPT